MIRNYVIVIAAAIMFNTNVFSQKISEDNKYEFGLRIAPAISWLTPDSKSISANGISLDWNYGFTVSKLINDRYALGTEINVVSITSKIKFDNVFLETKNGNNTATDLSMAYNLKYIQMPILFKMRTNSINNSKFRVYGEFGLGLGLLIRSKADVSSSLIKIDNMDVDNPDVTDRFTIKENANSASLDQKINFFNPAFIIGGGTQYDAFTNTKLYVGLRYNGGMIDILKENRWTATNSFTSLNLGIIF